MTATKIAPTKYYALVGNRSYVWIPLVAAADYVPTRAEIDAGTDVTQAIVSVEGFTSSTDYIETMGAGERGKGKVPGRITNADSSITFNVSKTGTDIRDLLTQDDEGVLCIFTEGDKPGNKMTPWPVAVGSVSDQNDIEDTGKCVVDFGVLDQPQQRVPVPASA